MKRDTNNQSTWRDQRVSGDLSLFWGATGAAANRIQALEADGFQSGTNAQVNTSGATNHYLALRDSP